MDISIIIVSYRSADLLMLTLASVRRSAEGLRCETFVVDNASADGTAERVKREAPWVKFIEMDSNSGFSRANNEAMRICTGRIVLILNPDTILCRDTLRDLINHFEQNPSSGAVGVRMVNGRGEYLRESKRGYTTLRTSFFKLTGLWKLAPTSATLNAYYVGQFAETDVCHAPVLSGACMAFTHELMDRVGFFDDTYFMYSEDIDLSWRMDKASGGHNTYRGDLPIIHFKGQSTPRQKKYIGYFYDSMLLFAAKHEFPNHNWFTNQLTRLGIKAAYLLSLCKCVLMRRSESLVTFEAPKHPCLVTDNAQLRQLTACQTTTYRDLSPADDADDVIFDIDGDVEQAIEYMRAKGTAHRYGFHNPDNGQTLVFYNNRCHPIEL